MAARELNRQNQIAPELALAQGPVPTGQLDGGATDGPRSLLRTTLTSSSWRTGRRRPRHLSLARERVPALLGNGPPVGGLERGDQAPHTGLVPSRGQPGIAPVTRSTKLFAVRSFYRFLIAEDMSEENPASLVTLASPVRSRIEFYSDAEADAIIEWASVQPGLRWQVGRVLLLTLRYTGLRAGELVNLRISDVDLDARRISLVGKGRKPRVVPFPYLLADALREYLDEIRPKLPASSYLFANPRATGGCAVVTGLGRCTIWWQRPGLRRA